MPLGRETHALTLLSSSDHVWGWPLARGCCCCVFKTLGEPGTFQELAAIVGHRLGKEGIRALCWGCRALLGSFVSAQALLSGEVAQVRAVKALGTSMALLFLLCPDATNALGLGGWVTAHRMPPGTHSPCCQVPWGDAPADSLLLPMSHVCCLPQALLPDSTAASVLHKCAGSCLPLSVC